MNAYLVTERMTANDDGILPSRNRLRDTLQDNRLTEDGTAKNVSDGAIRAPPHLLELEFFDASLIRGDGSALDTDAVLQNCFRRVHSDFITGLDST